MPIQNSVARLRLSTSIRSSWPWKRLPNVAMSMPGMVVGGTDARFYRDRGVVAYGAGLFSPSVSFESFGTRFHGNDERIDVESLGLSTEFWLHIAKTICG